jgi:CheY-like chemotaxis protein
VQHFVPMAQAEDRPDDLEAKLAEIRLRFVAGLPTRAKSFRATRDALMADRPEARAMARELVHRLAGVAGTHALSALGDAARACEDAIIAGGTDADIIDRLTSIADACDAAGESAASMPKRGSEPPPPLGASPTPISADTNVPEVLVVEDDPSTAKWICMALERAIGCRPYHAESGTDARALLATRSFALVILDGMLPGATGLELLAELRASAMHDGTRVMMLSASERRLLEHDALTAQNDADIWLTKPVPLDVLKREVDRLLARG